MIFRRSYVGSQVIEKRKNFFPLIFMGKLKFPFQNLYYVRNRFLGLPAAARCGSLFESPRLEQEVVVEQQFSPKLRNSVITLTRADTD